MSLTSPPTDEPAVRVLSFQAPYVCRHSGACCSAGWDIPITRSEERDLGAALDGGALALPGVRSTRPWRATSGLPDGRVAILWRTDDGDCVLLDREDGNLCRIQSARGHAALPSACQQFPRVTLLDDRGVHVTLSHYCPTVASLLCSDDALVDIVGAPASLLTAAPTPGLDARGHWPPLLRPGVLASPGAWTAWERFVVQTVGNSGSPLLAFARVEAAAERLRDWQPSQGPLDDLVARTLSEAMPGSHDAEPPSHTQIDEECERVWAAVPATLAERHATTRLTASVRARDAAVAALRDFPRPVGRYLAARAFASWAAYQGQGLRSHVASLWTALLLLLAAAGHEMRSAGGVLGPDALGQAARRADWLLVHLADSAVLCRSWSRSEA